MRVIQTAWFRGLTAALNVGALCLLPSPALGGEQGSAGDKIQFSDSSENGVIPELKLGDKHLSRRFEFLDRESSVGGVVDGLSAPAPVSSPSFQRNPRLWELFEQKLDLKRNWVYGRAEDINSQPTLAEMFGVRDAEPGAGGRKQQSAMARFFEDRGQKASPAQRGDNSLDDFSRRASSRGSILSLDRGSLASESLQPFRPFDMNRVAAAGFFIPDGPFATPLLQGTVGASKSLPGNPATERQTGTDDFRKLLITPSRINPLVAGLDPINLRVDSTRQELNPITPLPAANGAGLGLDAFDPLRSAFRPGRGGELSALEEMNAKALGSSSLSPAVAPPTPSRYTQPAPVILEFPTRKF